MPPTGIKEFVAQAMAVEDSKAGGQCCMVSNLKAQSPFGFA